MPHRSQSDHIPDPRRYALALTFLFALFIGRVLAQAMVGLGWAPFLPAWEEWFSGAVPYPQLLASQLAIIIVFGKVCRDFWRGHGASVIPRAWLGTVLLSIGSVYLSVMVIRYVLRMSLYPPERWTGGAIPIFFHWVLAGFILIVGAYHRASTPHPQRSRAGKAAIASWWAAVAVGVIAWVSYQTAPTLLAWTLDMRRAEYAVRIDRAVSFTTTDGITLVSDVYRPLRANRTPTVLVRIPFSKTITNTLFANVIARYWAERGYTVVIQGTRGRYESGGRHTPLVDERRDGLETLHWLRTQPWFDGRLAMWGGSAFGYTQWAIADQLPHGTDGRTALMIQISSTDFHRMFYPGGAFSLASALFWAVRSRGTKDVWPRDEELQRGYDNVPLIEADNRAVGDVGFFNDWVMHPTRDEYWRGIDGDRRAATLRAPVYLMAGWFDPFLPGQLADYVRIQSDASPEIARASRLVIGPWGHAAAVTLPGNIQTRNYRLESIAPSIPWFDRHLRGPHDDPASRASRASGASGAGELSTAPVRIYVMGANVWRDEQEWPLARARETAWYLHSAGHANSARGDGQLLLESPGEAPADVFIANPASPVPTTGGVMLGESRVVPQNDVESRDDVLVYMTSPLAADIEVTGPVTAILFVSASTRSADVAAKLVDVHPDGVVYNVCDGIHRGTYDPQPNPGTGAPTQIAVELWPTSMVFRRGHRIGLEIAGSNFPRFDRNLHTGEPSATARVMTTAIQAVHHGPLARSRLVMPVVEGRRTPQ